MHQFLLIKRDETRSGPKPQCIDAWTWWETKRANCECPLPLWFYFGTEPEQVGAVNSKSKMFVSGLKNEGEIKTRQKNYNSFKLKQHNLVGNLRKHSLSQRGERNFSFSSNHVSKATSKWKRRTLYCLKQKDRKFLFLQIFVSQIFLNLHQVQKAIAYFQ